MPRAERCAAQFGVVVLLAALLARQCSAAHAAAVLREAPVPLQLQLPPASPAATVYVRQRPQPGDGSTTLLAALQDQSATHIVLLGDIQLQPEEWASFAVHGQHVELNRSVVLAGGGASPFPVLDYDYAHNAVVIGENCTLFMVNLTTARQRAGSGSGTDLLLGNPGAAMVVVNGFRIRQACPPVPELLASKALVPRPPACPGQQVLGEAASAVQVHGTLFGREQQAVLANFCEDVAPTGGLDSGRAWHDGIMLWRRNVTWLCERIADDACLRQHGADGCLQTMLAQLNAAAPAGRPAAVAALAALAVALGALASAGAML